nr:substrate-binding domain-containing protein [Fulvivirga maritima]
MDNPYEIIRFALSDPEHPAFKVEIKHLLKEDDIHGIFITTSKGTYKAASLLEELQKHNIRLVGYDLLNENIEHLRKGTIDFLINQSPNRQASVGISYLANLLLFKKEPPHEELFPLEIITRQNLDSYVRSKIH